MLDANFWQNKNSTKKIIKEKKFYEDLINSLNENIKKLKDFAELSSDELIGGMDEIKGKRIKIDGYLEDFALTREEADNLIMAARNIVFKD